MGSSYQRLQSKNKILEDEVRKLKSNLVTIVFDPDSIEAFEVKTTVRLWGDVERAVWSGNTDSAPVKFDGILKTVN